jgi:hypothetical protein
MHLFASVDFLGTGSSRREEKRQALSPEAAKTAAVVLPAEPGKGNGSLQKENPTS